MMLFPELRMVLLVRYGLRRPNRQRHQVRPAG